MYSALGPRRSLTSPDHLSPRIHSQDHNRRTTFNKAVNEIFFTRSAIPGEADLKGQVQRKQPPVQLKIYHGVKGEEDWEQIQELPFSSDEYSIAHPALSGDGQRLVF